MSDTPRVYVGTYAKYNNGSIKGAWLDLDDYADKGAFLDACRELHKDEADPELMFQDFEGFPREFYNESWMDDRIWAWMELDEDDQELLAVYTEHVNGEGTIEEAQEAFSGKFDSEEGWAADFWESCGMLSEIPESLRNYIDYAAYANDCRFGGDMVFVRHEGDVWAFRNI